MSELIEFRLCCETGSEQNHLPSCPDMIALDESFKKDFDGSRFTDSYVNHNATSLHRKMLAGTYGIIPPDAGGRNTNSTQELYDEGYYG